MTDDHGSELAIDRSTWGRLRITGGDRERFLQGLTTVNVTALAAPRHDHDGAGQPGTVIAHAWGAILNPKGRVLSVIDIARLPEAFLIACEPSLVDKTRTLLERYAVMDDVAFEPITGAAHQVWADAVDAWRAPIVEGAHASALPDTAPEVERVRIRAGFVRYGVDVDEGHFPFEIPLAQFLDYGKGCYVGQEPVFRVHAQGTAARALRGLVIAGAAPVASGATIAHASRPNAGTVTSAIDAGDGTTIALGYLHRTCWDVGGEVTIDGRAATVRELPW